MKISCQSCHSKYNVADEKIQGKIVKIRCRKCGATIVVNASGSAGGNGTVPPPAPTSPTAVGEGGEGEWHVSVADDDQRTMTLAELVRAYAAGVVAQDTFVWTEGMADWKPLGEVEAVVAAARPPERFRVGGTATALPQVSDPPAPVSVAGPEPAAVAVAAPARTPAYGGGFSAPLQVSSPIVPEPKRAAVVKREARARDLFATRSGEEMHVDPPLGAGPTAPPTDDSRLTGQRNENSVLFSLDYLNKNADPPQEPPSSKTKDDSGLIDLKALAAKAESMRPPTFNDSGAAAPLGLAPSLGFVSPLGTPARASGVEAEPKSKLPLFIGGAAGMALLLVLGIVIGLKLGGGAAPATMASASASAAPPVASATAEPATSAAASASASAAAQAAASTAPPPPATAPPKPHVYASGVPKPSGVATKAPAAAGGGGSVGTSAGASGGGASGASAGGGSPTPTSKKGDCGCNGDLMCMMKCSTH